MLADLSGALSELSFEQYLPALLIVLFGALVARAIAGWVGRIVTGLRGERAGTNARRIALVPLFGLACVAALDYLEVDLSIFLGAAGVLTLLLGVAGKSAASEIVSGLFLVGDRPFRPGDSVRIGNVEGQVLSIDWLSVKVRTWQNTVVRIPNESVIKGEVTNLTRFAIRRFDVYMDVAYSQDLAKLSELLLAVADRLPYCLEDPAPAVRVAEFGASGPRVGFFVWLESDRFVDDRTRLMTELQPALQQAEIAYAFQRVVLESDGRSE